MGDNMIYSLSIFFNIYFCGGPFLWRPLGTCPVCPVLNPALGRGGSGPAESTAKLTDFSDSDIVIDMCIVFRHVIISKRAVSY